MGNATYAASPCKKATHPCPADTMVIRGGNAVAAPMRCRSTGYAPGEPSEAIRARLEAARRIQQTRFGKTKASCNARMSPRQSKEHCQLTVGSQELLRVAISELNFRARASDRILRVARTIADLAGREQIETEDVSEAIQYRTLDRNLWV